MTDTAGILTEVAGLSSALAAHLQNVGSEVKAGEDACLFRPGDECETFLLVLDGTVRVEHVNAAGRALVLYRLGSGDCCTITTSCLLTEKGYEVSGFVESPVKALAISRRHFDELMDTSLEFRRFAFSTVSNRLGDLVNVIDELLMRRTDLRLIDWLLNASAEADRIAVTHQGIADEIGTAREVVSRLLKEFERRGWLRLGRGVIAGIQRDALRATKTERSV